jgi:hypothetical protein
MKWICLLPLMAVASPAVAQSDEERGQTIIVTAVPLSQTERNLRDCIARHCPPEEDIAATLAHAENQFVAGEYQAARRTIRASTGRNDRFASRFPVQVSYLYRAGSRIAVHLGEGHDFEQSTWGIKRALKAGLQPGDGRLVAADLEVAGMHASLGRPESARAVYENAVKDAARIGRPDLAAIAKLRIAWLSHLDGDRPLARRRLEELAADHSPEARAARLSALVLLARFDRQEGKQASSDALIQELRIAGFSKPTLIYAPEIRIPQRAMEIDLDGDLRFMARNETLRLMPVENYDKRWIDVGFWITPDGRVNDMDILRHSGPTYWAQPLLKSIAGRLYSPAGDSGGTGNYRVERYSYTSLWMDRTGTHLRQRGPNARVEYLDLTAEDEPRASN